MRDQEFVEETLTHIRRVGHFMSICIDNLVNSIKDHDASKLGKEEYEGFKAFTANLAIVTYGSEEYKNMIKDMKPFLDKHWAANRHHPDYFKNGIKDMNLLDLLEMLCDWRAATERHNDGDIQRSIEQNQERFGYTDELKQILINTIYCLEGKISKEIKINICETCRHRKPLVNMRHSVAGAAKCEYPKVRVGQPCYEECQYFEEKK